MFSIFQRDLVNHLKMRWFSRILALNWLRKWIYKKTHILRSLFFNDELLHVLLPHEMVGAELQPGKMSSWADSFTFFMEPSCCCANISLPKFPLRLWSIMSLTCFPGPIFSVISPKISGCSIWMCSLTRFLLSYSWELGLGFMSRPQELQKKFSFPRGVLFF